MASEQYIPNPVIPDDIEGLRLYVRNELDKIASFLARNIPPSQILRGDWNFRNSTTAADPGSGSFRINNATPGLATEVYISQIDAAGNDRLLFMRGLKTGDLLYFQEGAVASNWAVAQVVSITDNTGWWTIGITNIKSAGVLPTNNSSAIVAYQAQVSGGVTIVDILP